MAEKLTDRSPSSTGTASPDGVAHPTTVLIVEGYGQSREGLTHALRSQALTVETAADCMEAIRKMKDGRFGVAIVDVDLPAGRNSELTGWDLARIFRALHPSAALILVTAEWRAEIGNEAERLRDCCLIEKPINPAELRAMVRALQGEAR
jgi:DNA-binding response OmpR family regulator